ncbi:cytochrome c oxidase assembly protein [Mesorhizobium sp. 1B3]|uniref:cytochrome c oxidase assembly protein n=1 Tax=Mesorhizobium sp. 1B3 TaxID=3243599 RepID=UPI003D97C2C0
MNWLDPSICFGSASTQAGWTIGLPITLPLALTALLYGAGAQRLWRRSRRGRPTNLARIGLFWAGWLSLAIALVTPLHALSERLFTAHMIEHEMMMVVSAPLLAASAPIAEMLWALPQSWRLTLARVTRAHLISSAWVVLTLPAVATVLHGLAIWLWHLPILFEAALERGPLHYAQHASFLGTGLLFWWTILPRNARTRAQGTAVLHLFLTSLHTGLLGVLLFVSPRLWYPSAPLEVEQWGLSALEDQQLAGLVMWMPAGLVYGAAALLLAERWISATGRSRDRRLLSQQPQGELR